MIRPAIASLALAFTLMLNSPASAQGVSDQEAYEIAKDAYVYAYPLVLTHLTAKQTTNYAGPTGIPTQAPVN